MGFGLFFLPLIGGYFLITHWNFTRFLTYREEGYRLLFRSAGAAVILAIIARLLVVETNHVLPQFGQIWTRYIPWNYTGTALLAFLLGFLGRYPLNWIYPRSKAARRAMREDNNVLEALLVDAVDRQVLIELTLKSRKVYVGWVVNVHESPTDRTMVPILPLASGYRDKDTLQLEFTTNYAGAYEDCLEGDDAIEGLEQGDFQVLVPVAEVVSIRLFDPDAYERFGRAEPHPEQEPDTRALDEQATPDD